MPAPLTFRWSGEAMVPRSPRAADERFVVGEIYRCDVIEERSIATHNHFFAQLHDQWMSLPDHLAVQFPTADTLRKHALIMTGFRRERKFVASSEKEARKLAAFLKPQTSDDDYAIVSLAGTAVVEWKAQSQSRQAMPEKGRFQASKVAVLEYVDEMLGVERGVAA